VKRGEIWSVSGGADYSQKPRPSVILQNNDFSNTESVTLCPFTTHHDDPQGIRITVLPDETNGIAKPSRIMVDKISTVHKAKIGERIGVLGESEMSRLNIAAGRLLGLARMVDNP